MAEDKLITGTEGDDLLEGGEGNDTLKGLGGNDTLNGMEGEDVLEGGLGDDTYQLKTVEIENADGEKEAVVQEQVVEQAGEGIDTVILESGHSYDTGKYTYVLGDNVENLILEKESSDLSATGNELNNHIIGSKWSNTLKGMAGDDTIEGGGGYGDKLYGGAGNDLLMGGESSEEMFGGEGDDTFIGGGGSDDLTGGEGSDTFKFDVAPSMFDNPEIHDFVSGTDHIALNSNIFAGIDADNIADVFVANETGVAEKETDRLIYNTTTGELFYDADGSIGGLSRRVLTLKGNPELNAEDIELFVGSEGSSGILIKGTFEDNYMVGESTGGDDTLEGLAGNDTLSGGLGNDMLIGGEGADVFLFDSAPGANNIDTISDFVSGTDRIMLDQSFFPGVADKSLDVGFVANETGTAESADNLIIYNTATGELSYDADGNGAGEAVVFAKLEGAPELKATDFILTGKDLEGTDGADNLVGTAGEDTLKGLAGDDTLTAMGGDDTLDGGEGVDMMDGGQGNDFYLVDATGDTVVEAADEGVDSVESTADYTLSDNVEHLTLLDDAVAGTGNALDNNIVGNDNGNTLIGGAGNDTLVGGKGEDTLTGGAGDDTYVLDSIKVENDEGEMEDVIVDQFTEEAGEGIDTVVTVGDASYTLGANVENLILDRMAYKASGTGNELDNHIVGSSWGNKLEGLGGNDTLDGAGSYDTLIGGEGNDVFRFTKEPDYASPIIEDFVSGTDRIELDGTIFAGIEADNIADVFVANETGEATSEDHRLIYNTSTGELLYDADGSGDGWTDKIATLKDSPVLTAADIGLIGEDTVPPGPDAIVGTDGDDDLVGTAEADLIQGLAGNDTLNGMAGADTLEGGLGDDTYQLTTVEVENAAGEKEIVVEEQIVEQADEGTDTVIVTRGDHDYTLGEYTYTLGDNVENLVLDMDSSKLSGTGNELDNHITGSKYGNTLKGMGGNDTLEGMGGIGDVLDGGAGNDLVIGGESAEELIGGEGDDTLNGAGGSDTLTGGEGSDTFKFDVAPSDFDHIEVEDFVSGTDRIALNSNVFAGIEADGIADIFVANATGEAENATDRLIYNTTTGELFYDADGSVAGAARKIATLTGSPELNAEDIEMFVGSEGSSGIVIDGTEDDDMLVGTGGDDTLNGLDGDDTLNGGQGADMLNGGEGGDAFHFDSALGAGNVDTIADFTSGVDQIMLDQMLFAGVDGEDMAKSFVANDTGMAENADQRIIYNTATGELSYDADGNGAGEAVVFAKLEGAPELKATDIILTGKMIEGTDDADNLVGSGGKDTLLGLAGDDTLTGLAGADILDGGADTDMMTGGQGDDLYMVDAAGDQVIEAADEGVDTVMATVDHTLADNVEHLVLQGDAVAGTGNAMDNNITGNDKANTLMGDAGNDTLVGGLGEDTLTGGVGDDTYVVDTVMVENASGEMEKVVVDQVSEEADQGTDTVVITGDAASYVLGANIENLVLDPSGYNTSGTGNELDNHITGSKWSNKLEGLAGNDTIEGMGGGDTLIGGEGNDVFRFTTEPSYSAATIEDFVSGTDRIELDGEIFTAIESGKIDEVFVANETGEATSEDQRLIYNTLTGELFYDADGSGDGISGLIATFTDSPALTAADIGLIGDDTVPPGPEPIMGTEGDDELVGTADADIINGLAGDDTLVGAGGADTLIGGAGDDVFRFTTAPGDVAPVIEDFVSGTDHIELDATIFTGIEADMIADVFVANETGEATSADQRLIYNTASGELFYDADGSGEGDAQLITRLAGSTDYVPMLTAEDISLFGDDTVPPGPGEIVGTTGDDNLYGTDGDDSISGLAGNDSLFGRDGDDTLAGGDGDDMLRGYDGADLIDGDAGNDLAYGGDGDDTVNGGAGNDSLYGGNGADLLAGGDGDDFIFGGEGRDSLDGGDGNDGLYGGTGNDVINGGAGADMVQGGHGNDSLTGGADNDSLYGGSGSDNLDGGSGMDFLNGGDGADFLSGGADNDTVMGGMDNDIIHGNEGDDLLLGQQGDDNLHGDDGNDLLIGGAGDDTLIGDSGMDKLFGKEGNDLFVLDGDSGDIDTIFDFTSGEDHLQLSGEIFAGLAEGELGEDMFAANATGSAMDADDHILYNTSTGALFYDADGNGEGAAVQLATLTNKEDVQSTDILVA